MNQIEYNYDNCATVIEHAPIIYVEFNCVRFAEFGGDDGTSYFVNDIHQCRVSYEEFGGEDCASTLKNIFVREPDTLCSKDKFTDLFQMIERHCYEIANGYDFHDESE